MANHIQFQHRKITAYHPATNGLCEQTNQQVVNILRGMVNGKDQYWDLYLKDTQMALSQSIWRHTLLSYVPLGPEDFRPLVDKVY